MNFLVGVKFRARIRTRDVLAEAANASATDHFYKNLAD